MTEEAKPLLNTTETCCARLGIKPTTLKRMLRENLLSAVKLGHRTMIPEHELLRFVASLAPRR